jgi:hypothetical protein
MKSWLTIYVFDVLRSGIAGQGSGVVLTKFDLL